MSWLTTCHVRWCVRGTWVINGRVRLQNYSFSRQNLYLSIWWQLKIVQNAETSDKHVRLGVFPHLIKVLTKLSPLLELEYRLRKKKLKLAVRETFHTVFNQQEKFTFKQRYIMNSMCVFTVLKIISKFWDTFFGLKWTKIYLAGTIYNKRNNKCFYR